MSLIELNADALNSASRDDIARLAFGALTPIQEQQPHLQVFAVALLFAAYCNRLSLDPQEMHHKAMRMMRDQEFHHKANVQLDAMRDFAGIHLTKPPTPSFPRSSTEA